MYNDFVIIGPKSDPAGIKGKAISAALTQIKFQSAQFMSCGDDSGTNKKGKTALEKRRHRLPGQRRLVYIDRPRYAGHH